MHQKNSGQGLKKSALRSVLYNTLGFYRKRAVQGTQNIRFNMGLLHLLQLKKDGIALRNILSLIKQVKS